MLEATLSLFSEELEAVSSEALLVGGSPATLISQNKDVKLFFSLCINNSILKRLKSRIACFLFLEDIMIYTRNSHE